MALELQNKHNSRARAAMLSRVPTACIITSLLRRPKHAQCLSCRAELIPLFPFFLFCPFALIHGCVASITGRCKQADRKLEVGGRCEQVDRKVQGSVLQASLEGAGPARLHHTHHS
eukprot:1159129-Pelagomonas_calceolata.AAC.3